MSSLAYSDVTSSEDLRSEIPTRAALGPLEFDAYDSLQTVCESLIDDAEHGNSAVVVTPNIQHLALVRDDEELAEEINAADYVLPDGWPIARSLRLFHETSGERLAGSDLTVTLLDMLERTRSPLSVAIVGGADDTLLDAHINIAEQYPSVRIIEPIDNPMLPGRPTDASKRALVESLPEPVDIVLLCMGAPKSELHAQALIRSRRARVVLCVGATVDFLAGTRSRAPKAMQSAGFEWLYRLAREPRRLGSRYRDGALAFMRVFGQELQRGSGNPGKRRSRSSG